MIDPRVEADFYRDPATPKADRSLRILLLGGTKFIGPPTVQYAIERGHEVTLLNRQLSNEHLFPQARRVRADRLGDTKAALAEVLKQDWDAVIDTWQGSPLVVQETVELLRERARQYLYISSISVYGRENYVKPEITEDSPLSPLRPMPTDKKEELDYRARKHLADECVRRLLPDRATVVRAHAIGGFYLDPRSESQLYWPVRFQAGGDVLCPGDGKDQTQLVDVRDVAR